MIDSTFYLVVCLTILDAAAIEDTLFSSECGEVSTRSSALYVLCYIIVEQGKVG